MSEGIIITKLLERIRYLADLPLGQLRSTYTSVTQITTVDEKDDAVVTKGMSRGQMIKEIIEEEFLGQIWSQYVPNRVGH